MVVERIGEVVESASSGFTVQCYSLYDAPPLGALVRTLERTVYGVNCNVYTAAIDPSRRPTTMGRDEDTEDSVYQSNPQLSQLLRTDFQVMTLGYGDGANTWHVLPPAPPRIYAFVRSCNQNETCSFASSLGFLPMLLAGRMANLDEVIIACLRQLASAHSDSKAFLVRSGRELARLMSNDAQRLSILLGRLLV
jgi:hypothetical protein